VFEKKGYRELVCVCVCCCLPLFLLLLVFRRCSRLGGFAAPCGAARRLGGIFVDCDAGDHGAPSGDQSHRPGVWARFPGRTLVFGFGLGFGIVFRVWPRFWPFRHFVGLWFSTSVFVRAVFSVTRPLAGGFAEDTPDFFP